MSLLSLAWIGFVDVASSFGYRPRCRSLSPNPVHSMHGNLCAPINRDNRTFSVPVEYKSQKLPPRNTRVSSAGPCSSVRQVNHGRIGKINKFPIDDLWKLRRWLWRSPGRSSPGCEKPRIGRQFYDSPSELWAAMPLALASPHHRQHKTQQNLLRSTKPNIKIQFRQWSY